MSLSYTFEFAFFNLAVILPQRKNTEMNTWRSAEGEAIKNLCAFSA